MLLNYLKCSWQCTLNNVSWELKEAKVFQVTVVSGNSIFVLNERNNEYTKICIS